MQIVESPLVLIAEINEDLGIGVCDAARAAGFRVAGPVARGADAGAYLDREKPDSEVSEPSRKDGGCAGTRDRLSQRGVPFVIQATCETGEPCDWDFAGAPYPMKPAVPRDLVIVLDALTSRSA